MTIRKGRPWGEDGPLADDGVVVSNDAEAAEILTEALELLRSRRKSGEVIF